MSGTSENDYNGSTFINEGTIVVNKQDVAGRLFHTAALGLVNILKHRAASGVRLHRKLIVTSQENLASPKISPDGRKVAYISKGRLYIRDQGSLWCYDIRETKAARADARR